MTQEEKDLVIKDLCGRLPYNCIVSLAEGGTNGIQWDDVTLNSYLLHQIMEEDAWEYVKPYLRPMNSMTDEEEDEYEIIIRSSLTTHIDWLNKNMFDYRGLIPRRLAIESPKGMYGS